MVPGITAASGCAAYAGIPLTHRDHAQSVRFVTAHGKGAPGISTGRCWPKTSRPWCSTWGSSCATIREQLLTHGKAGDTPVALIERGTQPSQRVIRGTLGQLPALAVGVESPALIMVGSVVTLADQLAWFGQEAPQMRPWPRPDRCIYVNATPGGVFFCIYCHNLLF